MRFPFAPAGLFRLSKLQLARHASNQIIVPPSLRRPENYGIFISAPDIPPDTEADNPFLRLPDSETWPPLANVDPFTAFRAFAKRCIELQTLTDEIEQQILENPDSISLKDLIYKLESHSVPLQYVTALIGQLESSSPDFYFRRTRELFNSYNKAIKARYLMKPLYFYLESLDLHPKSREERLIRQFVRKLTTIAKMEGTHLPEDDARMLDTNNQHLKLHSLRFRWNILDSNKAIANETIYLNKYSKGVSSSALKEFVRLIGHSDSAAAKYFLQNCPDGSCRKNFWTLWNQRAIRTELSKREPNTILVEKLRTGRRNLAEQLGYEDYFQYAMQTKMAGHVDNVRSMINTLHVRSRTAFERDLEELTKFAKEQHPKEAPSQLEVYDLDFYRKLYTSHHFDVNNALASQYFPLKKVLSGIFALLSKLFDIEVSEVPSDKFTAWSSDVRLFDVSIPHGRRGSFYFDPFSNTGAGKSQYGSYTVCNLLSKSEICKTHPISCISLFLPPNPIKTQDLYLNFDQVIQLHSAFGSILEHIMTEVPYREINGTNYIEADTALMVPYLLSLFPLLNYETLKECTSHAKTGQVLPQDLHEEIVKGHFKFSTFDLSRELHDIALDIALHTYKEYWLNLTPLVWSKYMKPFNSLVEEHVCSSTDILVREPAAKYCTLWSKMLACDIYKLMSENPEVSLKFRDSFLAARGEFSATDLWKALTGRNPSAEPLAQLTRVCITE